MQRTLDEVKQEGLDALRQRLGRADMIRFLQQFETGHSDYAEQRHEWVDRRAEEARNAAERTDPPRTDRPIHSAHDRENHGRGKEDNAQRLNGDAETIEKRVHR